MAFPQAVFAFSLFYKLQFVSQGWPGKGGFARKPNAFSAARTVSVNALPVFGVYLMTPLSIVAIGIQNRGGGIRIGFGRSSISF